MKLGRYRLESKIAEGGMASVWEAHDEMLRVVDSADAYELHINLIRHGRAIGRPKPRCEACGLRRMCPYWRRLARTQAGN